METTKEHFKIFKNQCKKWVAIFSLKRWKIYYEHKKLKDSFGKINYDLNAMNATMTLSTDWDGFEINKKTLSHTAYHEVIHLLIGRLDVCAMSRFTTVTEITEAIHEIIRILENVMFDKLYEEIE